MATSYNLHVVRTPGVRVPALDAVGGRTLQQWFSEASFGKLQIVPFAHESQVDTSAATAATLQRILEKYTSKPQNGEPSRDLCLIFCRKWVEPLAQLYGIMFDYDGYDPDFGFFRSVNTRPREGCAVFLESLPQADDRTAVATAIHELGHIFNLQHSSTHSFMAPGLAGAYAGFGFEDQQRLALAAEGNFFFAPGLANFGYTEFGQGQVSPALMLTASTDRDQYLLGEPIVLDLECAPRKGEARLAPILDPSWDALRIFIESPEGEVRIHRSPYHSCRTGSPGVPITAKNPLRNNPRITLGRDGFNFRMPGRYRVWAELHMGPDGRLVARSDAREVDIISPRNEHERTVSSVLLDRRTARFVAHKGWPIDKRRRGRLERCAKLDSSHPALQHIRYALASDSADRGNFRRAREWAELLRSPGGSVGAGIRRLRRRLHKHES